ncbi:MAG: MFS transporter [Actinomycetota bacterium]
MLKRGFALIFKRRDFGLLMATQYAAQAGDGIVQAALAKLIVFGGQEGFDLEGAKSPDELLRIALYIFVPYTIVSPFLGVVIDRWDRRRLLFVANGLRAAVIGLVALAGSSDIGDAPLFLAFLLTLASTRLVLATKSAALPATLDGESLVEANAVSQLGGAIFQLGGAGAALLAADLIDTDPIVLVGALVYAAGAMSALLIRKAGEPRRQRTSLGGEAARVVANIVAGLREVSRTPAAAASITTYFWLRLLWSFTIVGIGFQARELLADDDLQVLLVTGGAGAVGAGLGFVLARALHDRVKTTALLVISASAIAGGATAVLGPLTIELALAVLTFCLGFGFFLGKISLDTMVQESLGDDFRGRAFSLYDIAYNLAWVIAAGAMKVAWTDGREGLLISAMGLVFLAGLVLIGLWYRQAGLLGGTIRAEAEVHRRA